MLVQVLCVDANLKLFDHIRLTPVRKFCSLVKKFCLFLKKVVHACFVGKVQSVLSGVSISFVASMEQKQRWFG